MAKNLASNEIISQKLAQASRKLAEMKIDLWITFVQETSSGAERVFSYISPGHLTWDSAILVTPAGETTVICGKLDQQDFEQSGLFKSVVTFLQDFKEPFVSYLKALDPKRVAVNFSTNDASADGITHGRYLYLEALLKETLPGVEILSAEAIIGSLISQKSQLGKNY